MKERGARRWIKPGIVMKSKRWGMIRKEGKRKGDAKKSREDGKKVDIAMAMAMASLHINLCSRKRQEMEKKEDDHQN